MKSFNPYSVCKLNKEKLLTLLDITLLHDNSYNIKPMICCKTNALKTHFYKFMIFYFDGNSIKLLFCQKKKTWFRHTHMSGGFSFAVWCTYKDCSKLG